MEPQGKVLTIIQDSILGADPNSPKIHYVRALDQTIRKITYHPKSIPNIKDKSVLLGY